MKPANCSQNLQKICEKYTSDRKYVYKICCDLSCENFKYTREWLVVMENCDDTISNEARPGVVDMDYAPFRANKMRIVDIINVFDPTTKKKTSIINIFV